MLTNEEKEGFCSFAASLFAPPNRTMVDDLQHDELLSRITEYARKWGGDGQLQGGVIKAADRGKTLSALQAEYTRLFGEWEEKISLVESTYKTWTTDKGCQMVFAASKGLVMGDYALHMQELYRRASLEIPEEYRSMPDHLVLQLEFLALMYRFASDEAIERFIGDHLDWIQELKGAMETAKPHPFYWNAVELLHLFLQHEIKNGKVKDHGQKKIH
jgi:putative dimethyl sulfoxide reductase chaperone